LDSLVAIRYERNDIGLVRNKFRVRGDIIEIWPSYGETPLRIELVDDTIEKISEIHPVTGKPIKQKDKVLIYPASHFVVGPERYETAITAIEQELDDRLKFLNNHRKLLEAERLEQRTRYDLEMLRATGFCHGIENYSRHLSGRPAGERPQCLIDYFDKTNFLTIIDESHVSLPQVRGMYEGDKSRKRTLVDFGFRLPSAMDHRPLKFDEFNSLLNQTIYISATPSEYEIQKSGGVVVEQVIRPTGLIDPEVIIKPVAGQVNDLITEITKCAEKKERVLVTTLTKRMAEDLADFLANNKKLRVKYIHSEIDALDRIEIIRDLRKGNFDCLVGINLLREGLDLPEVSLVAVLDADKEGFLRSETSLIQVSGRAARHINGKVIMYADNITGSIKRALAEMDRRRIMQLEYNKKNDITPKTIIKAINVLHEFEYQTKKSIISFIADDGAEYAGKKNMPQLVKQLEQKMKESADVLDFELAALYRDKIYELKQMRVDKSRRK
jgi:excinuclease ABC subunit B